jgi:hypothetical protein
VPVTMKQVRAQLDRDEPDYPAAAQLGANAIPHLAQLVQNSDPMLASKAAYLASLIQDDRSNAVLKQAAHSSHNEVRIAAAAGIRNIESPISLADILLNDRDVGVRKVALRSIEARSTRSSTNGARFLKGLKVKVQEVAQRDSDIFIRNLASRIANNLR